MKTQRLVLSSIAILVILACNIPASVVQDVATAAAASPIPSATPLGSTIPFASPSGAAVNCRVGPGTSWAVLTLLNPGQSAEIVGVNAAGTWWYVKNPSLAGSFCWVSADFTVATGNVSGVPLAAEPPTQPVPPTAAGGSVVVTNVTVSIDPEDIQVGGCMGPIQPSTIFATITTNGAIKLNWHFVTEQNGAMPIHSLNFNKAGDKDVSAQFTPPLDEGTWSVSIVIDGMNLNGMDTSATYEIGC